MHFMCGRLLDFAIYSGKIKKEETFKRKILLFLHFYDIF